MVRRKIGVLAMALFPCSKCGCEDDTALCNYWSARLKEFPLLCSACDPKISKWHGEFPRKFETPPAAGPTRLVGLTRITEVGLSLAEINKEMVLSDGLKAPTR
jgi:hypothetical protein